jgi:hypothetical protein
MNNIIILGLLMSHLISVISAVNPNQAGILKGIIIKAYHLPCPLNLAALVNQESPYSFDQTLNKFDWYMKEKNKFVLLEISRLCEYILARRIFGKITMPYNIEMLKRYFTKYTAEKGARKIDAYYLAPLFQAFVYNNEEAVAQHFTSEQVLQLRSYFKTIVIYTKFYFIMTAFKLRDTPKAIINIIDYFQSNLITLSPTFYSSDAKCSATQYQNILTALELGTNILILDLLETRLHNIESLPYTEYTPPPGFPSKIASGNSIDTSILTGYTQISKVPIETPNLSNIELKNTVNKTTSQSEPDTISSMGPIVYKKRSEVTSSEPCMVYDTVTEKYISIKSTVEITKKSIEKNTVENPAKSIQKSTPKLSETSEKALNSFMEMLKESSKK